MRTAESVSIGSVFSKREDGKYTNSARTYQNILKYCLFLKRNQQSENGNNHSFTLWEVTDWLAKNINGSSHISAKARIENRQSTIKIKLRNLVELKLIRISDRRPMKKLEGTTLTYQCTKFGYLLAWIIESFDENCDEDLIQNEIYTLVSDIFTIREYSSASNIFFSKFVKKCNDRKEFKNIIALFRQGVSEGNPITITDLFQYIWRFDFEDVQTRIHFNNLFFETLNELDLETQELILYALKLDIERRMKVVSHDFEKFEQARFMNRQTMTKLPLNASVAIVTGLSILD